MARVNVCGVKIEPKWQWSREYRLDTQAHIRDLLAANLSRKCFAGTPAFTPKPASDGYSFRSGAERRLAESMVIYALWLLERDGFIVPEKRISITTHHTLVDLEAGTVRFSIHPDLDGHIVRIPNHDWQPEVSEQSN